MFCICRVAAVSELTTSGRCLRSESHNFYFCSQPQATQLSDNAILFLHKWRVLLAGSFPVPSWTLLSSYRSSFLRHIGIWRFVSSGVWRRFTRSFIPDVSKERSAFNFRGWGQHPSTIVTIVVFCFRLYGTWIANMAHCLGQANVLKGSDVCRTKRRNREPQDRQKPTELNWV